MKTFWLCLSLFLLIQLPAFAADVPANNVAAAKAYLQESFDASHYPGLSYVVVNREGVLLAGGFGHEVAGAEKAMDENSSSAIGSLTKSFTVFAMMRLVEEGRLDLDEKVITYLPWFQTARKQDSDKITVRHLLSNSSGIPSLDVGIVGEDDSEDSAERFVRSLTSYVIDREPGARFEYSNEGFAVAGLIGTTITGLTYPQFIAQYVLEPLGMSRSTTDPARFEELGALHGHHPGLRGGIPVTKSLLSMNYIAAGALLHCSSADLGAYLRALLNDGKHAGKAVIAADSIETMWRSHIEVPENTSDTAGSYCLGWMRRMVDERELISHGGNAGSMTSEAMLYPAKGFAVALLSNSGSLDGYRSASLRTIGNNVLHLLDGEPLSDFGKPTRPDNTLNTFELDSHLLANYVGHYRNQGLSNDTFVIAQSGKSLFLTSFEGKQKRSECEIDFINPVRAALRSTASTSVIKFKITQDNKVSGVSYNGSSFLRQGDESRRPERVSLVEGRVSFLLSELWQQETMQDGFRLLHEGNVIQGGFLPKGADVYAIAKGSGQEASHEMPEYGESISNRFWRSKAFQIKTQEGERQKRIFVTKTAEGDFYLLVDAQQGKLTRLLQTTAMDILSSFETATF